MSYLRYPLFVFTSSCLQEGSCLIYVMFGSSLHPVLCRRARVLFTLCSIHLYLQLFVGGLMSYLRYLLFVFTSSCLQEGSCLIYVMFGLSLPPVVCRRTDVLYTLCSVHLYLQLLIGGSCLIYVMFCSSLPPVVYRRAHVLLTLCSVHLYLQLFIGGFMSYIRYVLFIFTSSCLQEGSCLMYLCSVLFTSSCLQEGSCLIYVMFCSSLPPVVYRRAHVLLTLCSVHLYLQLFIGGLVSYLRYVLFIFTSSCLQEGSCLIYVMFCSSLPPVVYRRARVLYTLCSVHLYLQLFIGGLMSYLRYVLFSLPPVVCRRARVLFTLCSVHLYLQLFIGGLMSYLRYVRFVFTSSCLQEGSCLIYVMFCSSLPPVAYRRAHVLFTLCSVRLYLQLFIGGLMSYIRYVRFVFTSSCLQEGSCLIYVMFCSSLPPVVYRRAHVLYTLCSVRLYLQLFVGGLVSYLRYVRFVFTSSCLQEGACLIYVMFCSSISPVFCRNAHVLFTLCSVCLYLQLFVGGRMSYLRYVLFVFTSSCLQEGSCLIYVMFCSLYLQLFIGGLMSYLRYVRFVFTSSCLQEGSCLIYAMFCSSLPPVVYRRAHVLLTLCTVRLYLQLFEGGLVSYIRYVLFIFTSSCLQEGSCLIYVMFGSSLPPVVYRRAHVLLTLCTVRLYLQLFVGGLMSYLRYVRFVFTSSCLQED